MSPELLVMTAPARAFSGLAPGHDVGPAGALKRPLLVAIVVATAVSIYAARRVTVGLALSAILTWSVAVVVQALAAAALVASSKRRSVSVPAGLDLLFVGHGPWSLWLLAVAAWAAWLPRPGNMDLLVALSAAVPLVWTMVIVFAFCRVVLGDEPRAAAIRTLCHQSFVWTVAGLYIAVAVQLWSRVVGTAAS